MFRYLAFGLVATSIGWAGLAAANGQDRTPSAATVSTAPSDDGIVSIVEAKKKKKSSSSSSSSGSDHRGS